MLSYKLFSLKILKIINKTKKRAVKLITTLKEQYTLTKKENQM